jgi:signal transduction histidine kinase
VEGHGFPGTLTVVVSDDGIGGADQNGGGLSGLADRVAGVDGTVSVESPSGGPTIVSAVLPCG